MASVNKVILVGNCGRDPESRSTPSGTAVTTVSIATSSKRRDRASGEMSEQTEWHRVTFYDRLAEIARDYLRKGKPVYIEGRLKYGKYTDPQGVERYTVDIIANEMQMLGGRDGGFDEGGGGGGGAAYSRPAAPARAPAPSAPRQAPAPAADSFSADMDDDIPF